VFSRAPRVRGGAWRFGDSPGDRAGRAGFVASGTARGQLTFDVSLSGAEDRGGASVGPGGVVVRFLKTYELRSLKTYERAGCVAVALRGTAALDAAAPITLCAGWKHPVSYVDVAMLYFDPQGAKMDRHWDRGFRSNWAWPEGVPHGDRQGNRTLEFEWAGGGGGKGNGDSASSHFKLIGVVAC